MREAKTRRRHDGFRLRRATIELLKSTEELEETTTRVRRAARGVLRKAMQEELEVMEFYSQPKITASSPSTTSALSACSPHAHSDLLVASPPSCSHPSRPSRNQTQRQNKPTPRSFLVWRSACPDKGAGRCPTLHIHEQSFYTVHSRRDGD